MESEKKFTLKDCSEEDKPREKMLAKGKKELSNSELIGILLGSGTPGQNAVELGKEILIACDNKLSRLSKMEIKDICRFKGVGPAKAVTISAAIELGRRMRDEKEEAVEPFVKESSDLFKLLEPKLIDLTHEEFWMVCLNIRGKVVGMSRISSGGLTDTPVDIRLIFKYALERNATSICVAHNHPSGDFRPSKMDNDLTLKISEAGRTLNIRLVDHIIIGIRLDGKSDYFSYADNGKI